MESKQINIVGKRNTDKVFNIKDPKRDDFALDEELLDFNKQLEVLRKLYLNQEFDQMKDVIKVLEKKRKGYKYQDVNKQKYDEDTFITFETMIELLLGSKLKCKYCKQHMLLFYDRVGEKKQWTLDRIDNNYGHNNDNVVISCLNCNIKRQDLDYDRFKSSKEIRKINKQE